MAIQPRQPEQKQSLQKALTIGGLAIGGPGGAAAGSTIGGLVAKQPKQPVESQGMDRRRELVEADPINRIAAAQATLNALPEDRFPEARKALDDAMIIAKRNQQLGRQQGGLA